MAIVLSTSTYEGKEVGILIDVASAPSNQGSQPSYDYKDLRAFGGSAIAKVGDLYGKAIEMANICAEELYERISKIPETARPTEYSVEFGIEMNSELGAVIVRGTGGAHLTVSLTWTSKDR